MEVMLLRSHMPGYRLVILLTVRGLHIVQQDPVAAGQGSITVPGAIAATPVETPIDVEEGLQASQGRTNPVTHAFTAIPPGMR